MFNNPDIPVLFEIDEIENHLKSLSTAKLKLDYLKELYFEFVEICYNFSDRKLQNYLVGKNAGEKYYPIPYYASTDKYQTHISRSKYINLLRQIDRNLLPFVRTEIKKLDESFEEDHSKIIKDYPVFNFNKEKIFEHIDTLTVDKLSYISMILENIRDYYFEEYIPQRKTKDDINLILNSDELYSELKKMYITFRRYPERIFEKNIVDTKTDNDEPDLFKKDKSLCGFDLKGIKEHAKKFKNTNEAILYLLRVKKEAMQNRDLIPDKTANKSFFSHLIYEIEFYKEKQKMENEALSKQSFAETKSTETNKGPIRLHWQSDNILIPYLLERLFQEGFINNSDFELRRDFIEQSFYKNKGGIFSAKEAGSAESNYKLNTENKPKNSHKVDRVIDDIKSKRNELTKKKTSSVKKK